MAEKTRLTEQDLAVLIDSEMRQSFGYGDGKLEQLRRRAMYYFMAEAKEELAPPEIEGRSRVVDTTVRNTVLGMEAPLLKTFYGSDNVFEFEETKPGLEAQAKLISAYVNHIYRNSNPGYQITATWIREALTIKAGIIKVWWDESDVESREEYTGQTIEQLTMLLDDEEVEIIEQKGYEDADAAKQKAKALEQASQQLQQMAQAAQQASQGMNAAASAQAYQQASQQFESMQAQPVPQLYDVALKRVKVGGRVCIENVPPEEFLISKKAKSIKDTPYTGHRFKRTVSQLKQRGYKLPDPLPSDDAGAEQSLEREQRMEWVDDDVTSSYADDATPDASMREVWVVESYLQVDFDGDGIPEWRKVVKCGTEILENVEFDEPPFVALGSIPMPHQFYGLCPADLAIEHQKIKTSLTRAQLDNIYLQVNGRSYAVEGRVNLDDLLTNRPGGVVRVKDAQAVGPLQQGMSDMAGAMALSEHFQVESEEATGWTRQTQGGNGNQLQQTATQANIITNRADMRVESISRYMAETGFTDLGYLILKLVSRYQKKAEMVKIGGEWTPVDPREWNNHFNLTINVGLGTGNKDQLVSHLAMLTQNQIQGLQIGFATPENLFKSSMRLANALGFKNGDEFFTDPKQMPPKPAAQDPAIVKAQLADQAHQRDTQLKAQQQQMDAAAQQQKTQRDAELAQFKAQIEAQAQMATDAARQKAEAEKHALKLEYEAHFNALKEQNRMQERAQELAFQQYKLDKEIDAKIVIAQIAAKQQQDASLAAAEAESNKDMATDGDA